MLQSDSNIMFYIVITCRSMPLSLHWYNIYNSVSECIIIITIITIIIVIIRTKGEDTRDACCQAEIMQPTSETSSLNHFQFQPAVHFMKSHVRNTQTHIEPRAKNDAVINGESQQLGRYCLVLEPALWRMMEFVSWDDDIPNWMGKNVPNHQPLFVHIRYPDHKETHWYPETKNWLVTFPATFWSSMASIYGVKPHLLLPPQANRNCDLPTTLPWGGCFNLCRGFQGPSHAVGWCKSNAKASEQSVTTWDRSKAQKLFRIFRSPHGSLEKTIYIYNYLYK